MIDCMMAVRSRFTFWMGPDTAKRALGAALLSLACHAQAFETSDCEEHWFNQSIEHSDHNADRTSSCKKTSTAFKPLGRFYWLADGKAYFHTAETRRSSPCAGRGVGAMGNLLNPVCYLPSFLQVHRNQEIRRYWLASTDGANFRLATTRHPGPLAPLQAMTLARYALDGQRVYLNGEPIADADVGSFEVIFPFGADEHWSAFGFARDRDHVFIDEWALPPMDLAQVQWLALPCAEDVPE